MGKNAIILMVCLLFATALLFNLIVCEDDVGTSGRYEGFAGEELAFQAFLYKVLPSNIVVSGNSLGNEYYDENAPIRIWESPITPYTAEAVEMTFRVMTEVDTSEHPFGTTYFWSEDIMVHNPYYPEYSDDPWYVIYEHNRDERLIQLETMIS